MKEITMPKEVYLEKYDLHIRPYLTTEEVISIGELMVEADNPIEAEMCLAFNVLVLCTELKEEEVRDIDADFILYSGLWSDVADEIENLWAVRQYVAYAESPQIAIAKFLNKTLPDAMDKYLDALPKNDEGWEDMINSLPAKLKDVLELAKEDGNADIIRGALKMGES